MAEEPPSKKPADILTIFHSNTAKMELLNSVYDALYTGVQGMCLRPLQVTATNADLCISFSNAHCQTEGLSPNFTIGSVFKPGLQVLKLYLNQRIPLDKTMKKALQKLLEYITPENAPDELASSVFSSTEINEADLALRLAQHLLSKLAVSKAYTVDHHYGHKAKDTLRCPCASKEPLQVVFGDTSFGCSEAWHGSPDIIIDYLPVNVTSEEDDDDTEDVCFGGDSSMASYGLNDKDIHQMKAETIVFSFLQKKQCLNLKNYLVPSIGISRKKLVIHFYDCVGDVLLTSAKLDLFSNVGKKAVAFNYYAIVFLWLTLNYRIFCSGPTKQMKDKKSSFFSIIGDKCLALYEKEVKRPCKCTTRTEDDSWIWAPSVRDEDIGDIAHEPLFK